MEVLDDFYWADRFGWTPDQVDAMHPRRVTMLRHAAGAIDEGRQQAQEEQAGQARERR